MLKGLTVVAVEQAVSAPLATRHLADLGARVIKVERPDGDFARGYDRTVNGLSSYFTWLNRGKESVVLDLRSVQGQRQLEELVGFADVVVQNLSPRARNRVGLDPETLRSRDAGLIACAITGYPSSGPYAGRKAYDLLIQAETGLLGVTGDSAPARAGISIADIAAGMYAFCSVLAALYRRSVTGEGATIRVSMLESLAEWMGNPMYFAMYSGKPPPRTGARHPSVAPYGPFDCGDGARIFLAVQNDREWARFCDLVIERDDLAHDPRFDTNVARVANRGALELAIAEVIGRMDVQSVIARLEAGDIAHAELRDVGRLPEHPAFAGADVAPAIDSPVGPLVAMHPPFGIEGLSFERRRIPALGEDTVRVLRELDDLRRSGA